MKHLYLIIIVLLGHTMVFGSNQANQLKKVSKEISSIEKKIHHTKRKRAQLENKLRKIELSISDNAKKLEDAQTKVTNAQTLLANAESEKTKLLNTLTKQRTLLAKQLRAQYLLKNPELIKIILNNQNPVDIQRHAVYFKYLNQSRLINVKRYQLDLDLVIDKENEIREKSKALFAVQESHENERKRLMTQLSKREKIVDQYNAIIQDSHVRLSSLQEEQAQLEQVLDAVHTSRTPSKETWGNFGQYKGKLQYPTKGYISTAFNSPLSDKRLRSNGIVIRTNNHAPVKAVFGGEVIFANWMRGFGLLLIVEHGNGYMTLYAHNHQVYKKTGDMVKKGEVISKTGQSGGHSKKGLYFEIRKNGKPLNPTLWCA